MSQIFDWYKVIRAAVGIYVHTFIRSIEVIGNDLIPAGPKIIVANHANLTDGFILPFVIPERLHFLIQADVLETTWIGKFLTLADQVPIQIGRGKDGLQIALKWLERGEPVVIFPEGRLNNGQELLRAGSGAALLAAQSNAPLVPIGFYVPDQYTRMLKGKYQNRASYARFQFGGTCYVHVGKPMEILRNRAEIHYYGLRQATEDIMMQINELVNQAQQFADGSSRQKNVHAEIST